SHYDVVRWGSRDPRPGRCSPDRRGSSRGCPRWPCCWSFASCFGCFRWTASSLVGSLIVSASFTPGAGPVPTTTGQSPPDNQEVLPTTDDTDCRPSGTCMVSAPGCGAGRSLSAASMVTVAEAGRAQLGGGGA